MGTINLLADASFFASAEALALGVGGGLSDSLETTLELVSAHAGLESPVEEQAIIVEDRPTLAAWLRRHAPTIERILPRLVTWKAIDRFELPANWMESRTVVHRQPSLSVDAGGGVQASGNDSIVPRVLVTGSGDPSPLFLRTNDLFQSDIKSFQSSSPSLVGKVLGLTLEMEQDFMRGVRIIEHQEGNEIVQVYKKPGKDFAREAREDEVQAYMGWLKVMGFSQEEYASQSGLVIGELKHFLSQMGVEFILNIPLTPTQALYLLMVLQKIPKELYRSGYFQKLCIDETGLDMEIYQRGQVTLSAEAFRGARRDLIGSLLHGVGHAMADRYAMAPHEDSLSPDRRIIFLLRVQMNGAFEYIRNHSPADIYVLNWPGEPPLRKMYLMQEFREFFAEMFFIFLVDRLGLFQHVNAISNEAVKVLYTAILIELRERIIRS